VRLMAKRKRGSKLRKPAQTVERPADRRDWAPYFAHLNGQLAEMTAGIGGLVESVRERQCGPRWKRQLAGVLDECAGSALLSRVQGFYVQRGELRLEVIEPSERYHLGLQWEQRLLAQLRAQLPAAGITGVRFILANERSR